MKTVKALLLSMSLLGSLTSEAADPAWEWVQIAGGSSDDIGSGVAVSPVGEIYWSGCVFGGAKVGALTASQNISHFWAKVSPAGVVSTVRLAPMGGGPWDNAMTVDSAGFVYSAGTYYGSLNFGAVTVNAPYQNTAAAFIVRFDSALNARWAKSGITGGSFPSASPSINAQSEIVATTGFSSATVDGVTLGATGGNNQDVLTLKLQAGSGALMWMKRGGGVSYDGGQAVCFDAAGNVYVAGFSQSSTIAFGAVTVTNNVSGLGFVAKLNSTGAAEWVNQYIYNRQAAIVALKVAQNGDLIVGGRVVDQNSYPEGEAIFSRVTPNGTTVWSKSVPNLAIRDVALASDGTIIVSGTFKGAITINSKSFSSRGESDVFVGRFDANGNLLWAKTAGGAFRDSAGQVALAPDGAIYVAGTLRDGGSFDSTFVEGRGVDDAFIAKLSSSGALQVPQITTQPVATAPYFGAQTTLNVAASSTVSVTYQWFRDGAKITGANSATFTISSVRPGDDGNYYVEVTNQYGTVRSDSVRLIVRGDAPVVVTTLAGTNSIGFVDSTNAAAVRFYEPNSPAIQNDGVIVVADGGNHAIRLVEPNGTVGTLAGKGVAGLTNGPASVAYFNAPLAVALNPAWDIFVADAFNNVVRKISGFGTRQVTTYAGTGEKAFQDGPAAQAKFNFPNDLVCDADGNVYVTEFEGHRVRKISTDGIVSTVAGTGTAGYRDGAPGQALLNH
jgi:hypothetical protein